MFSVRPGKYTESRLLELEGGEATAFLGGHDVFLGGVGRGGDFARMREAPGAVSVEKSGGRDDW